MTGNPGEDYGCRCWAEPVGGDVHVRQTLISHINDNRDAWSNLDFLMHYRRSNGMPVTLQQTGYLRSVIEHYSETLDIYSRVNRQIIDIALTKTNRTFTYEFSNSYNFGTFFSGVKFSFGDSTVKGIFKGEVENTKEFAIISGIVTYTYDDTFTDPFSKVENLMESERISREEAEARVGRSGDTQGVPYKITDQWQTKFNATIRLGDTHE